MHQLHPPDSTRRIEIIVKENRVKGTVRLIGSSRMEVRLGDLSSTQQISFFSRVPPGEPGYLGKYGETLAQNLLLELYENKCNPRRAYARGYEEFGEGRYIKAEPKHPSRDRNILGQVQLENAISVQLGEDGKYRLARFYDSASQQPFLSEAAVCESSITKYVKGIEAEINFAQHVKSVHARLLPGMVAAAALLKSYDVNPYQADVLWKFGRVWRAGVTSLGAAEIDHLIERGYLTRNPERCATEIDNLKSSMDRRTQALEKFEKAGRVEQADECRAKISRLKGRINLKALMITPEGKAAGRKLWAQIE